MDNPAGCPRAHPQAVGCPQAPQDLTITIEKEQEKRHTALRFTQQPDDNSSSPRRCSTRSNRPQHYNLLRATQQPIEIGHVPEITGHVRRNTHFVNQGQQHYEEQQRERSIAALKRRAAALGFAVMPTAMPT